MDFLNIMKIKLLVYRFFDLLWKNKYIFLNLYLNVCN